MKIKLSKSQWETMGKKAGWVAPDETNFLDEVSSKTLLKALRMAINKSPDIAKKIKIEIMNLRMEANPNLKKIEESPTGSTWELDEKESAKFLK